MFVMQIVGIELNGEERGKLERNEGFREERERERERGTRREERAAARRRNLLSAVKLRRWEPVRSIHKA